MPPTASGSTTRKWAIVRPTSLSKSGSTLGAVSGGGSGVPNIRSMWPSLVPELASASSSSSSARRAAGSLAPMAASRSARAPASRSTSVSNAAHTSCHCSGWDVMDGTTVTASIMDGQQGQAHALPPVACGGEEDTAGPAPTLALTIDTDGNFHDEDDGDDRDPLRFSDWSAPVNLGPPINGAFADAGSFISKDGLSFYVSSTRPGGCGNFDIWVSTRETRDEAWGEPQNLGCDVNSSGFDAAPFLT